jgi:aryl carrier-like protein
VPDIAGNADIKAAVHDVWHRILKVAPSSEDDNFFDLGGSSFRAIRVSRELSMMGYQLSVIDVMEAQTIRRQVEVIVSKLR